MQVAQPKISDLQIGVHPAKDNSSENQDPQETDRS